MNMACQRLHKFRKKLIEKTGDLSGAQHNKNREDCDSEDNFIAWSHEIVYQPELPPCQS